MGSSRAGTNLPKIEEALAVADVVVVLWSPHSVHSHWVRDEAATGRDRGRMVPVTISGVDPPLGFRQFQQVDLTKWRGRANASEIDKLCQAIASCAGRKDERFKTPKAARSGLSRRGLLVGGGAGILVVGGATAAFELLKSGRGGHETSIGVLPFRNLGGDASEDYVSEGIADELRAILSENGNLAVAAETSSSVADKSSSEPRAIASALGVNYLLEGSIRRNGDMMRIAAQIVDGSTGFDQWSQNFDRKVSDILSAQSEIAAFVTDALLSSITAAKRPRDRVGGTRNTDAFNAYVKGLAIYKLAGSESSDMEALGLFRSAVALDPSYAVALSAMSRSLTVIANSYDLKGEASVYYKKAEEAARAAIKIAPKLADGYSALGFVLLNGDLNPGGAAAAYQRSFALGYGNADILTSYASFASRTGRFADGRVAISRAQRLDPLNPTVFRTAGFLELDARQFDAASTAFHTALSLNPNATAIHVALGDLAYLSGDAAAAREQYAKESDPIGRLRGLAIADMKLSKRDLAQSEFSELTSKYGDISYYQQAQVLAQWGRTDEALGALEKAVTARDAGVVRSKSDPMLDPIRKTVKFAKVERDLGYA